MADKPRLEQQSKDHMAATTDYLVFGADNLLGDPVSAAIALATAAGYFVRKLSAEDREVVCRAFENGVKLFPPPEAQNGAPN